ncbi:MAG: protein kinase [Deltaproteobacteria bacterium]
MDPSLHRFGPFLIVRTLGRGGMGEVFIARTPWDENPLAAVKRLRPDVARVPTFAERFQHESELAVRLSHQHVVGTLDVGSVEGQLYVASVLVMGKDTGIVADRLRERGQGGPAAVAIRLLIDTLAGLGYVHGVREPDGKPLKLVHRDVTPGNVLVGYDGIARVADFGLAKSLLTEGSNLTNHGEILGTPHYLAPEVIRGEPASPASDLYGLGAVMYRFLTGVAPHQGTTAEVLLKVLSETVRPLSDLRPDLPPWLVSFVHRLLDKDPSRRPQDAAKLLAQLTNDARNAGLLVPRTAVGHWLGKLFEAEKGEELEERDRIVQIDIEEYVVQSEGTVVLARPRAGSRLEGPKDLETAVFDEHQGTELDLVEDEIHSAVAQIGGRPAPTFDGEGTGPSDVTMAANVAHVSELDEDDDGMPTRAVSMFPDLGLDAPLPTTGKNVGLLDIDTSDGDAETQLPGFIDRGAGFAKNLDSFAPGGITNPDPASGPALALPSAPAKTNGSIPPNGGTSARQRRSNPDSVIVKPVGSSSSPGPEDGALDPTFRPSRSAPRAIQEKKSKSEPSAPRAKARVSAPAPVATPQRPSRATGSAQKARPQKRNSSASRNLMLLAGLLLFAIAVGIGIGTVVAKIKSGDRAQADLRSRYGAISAEIKQRQANQRPIPNTVWQYTNSAADALLNGDEAAARLNIEEAERLLAVPPAP